MTQQEKPTALIWRAISSCDRSEVKRLFSEFPDQINSHIPFGGGTFLHLAASKSNVDVVRELVNVGFDINKKGNIQGETALAAACAAGNIEIVDYFLNIGAVMDVSNSGTNPLFSAIVGKSKEIVELLLAKGIDARARYTSSTMKNMDAVSFALERGEDQIARIIAESNAEGDLTKAASLITDATEIARINNHQ